MNRNKKGVYRFGAVYCLRRRDNGSIYLLFNIVAFAVLFP